jgi:hypothetical protein
MTLDCRFEIKLRVVAILDDWPRPTAGKCKSPDERRRSKPNFPPFSGMVNQIYVKTANLTALEYDAMGRSTA